MIKLFKKLIGHRYGNRYSWGEFYWTLHPKHWDLSVKLTDSCNSGNDMICFCPLLFKSYIDLPTKFCQPKEYYSFGDGKSYGFYVYSSIKNFTTLVFQWDKHSKHIEMPWTYKWYSEEILDFDGKVVYYDSVKMRHIPFENRFKSKDFWKKEVAKQVKFKYKLKNGKIQNRIATIFHTRSTYKMRALPWIKKTYNYVDYTFNDEVGEKTGSWKGGVIASSEIIKDGETPLQAFRRMEKERKFN
jgi:hypothetical protein